MPFCPNSDCPPRRRSGRPAEYQASVTHCVDCGTALVNTDPRPGPAPRRACPAPLKRRLLVTAGLAAALIGLAYLPLPASLVDPQAIEGLRGTASDFSMPLIGLLSLGVTPFLVGFGLVELFALCVGRLRRRRLSDLGLRRTLWRAALIVGAAWAFVQGVGTAISLESIGFGTGYGYGGDQMAVGDPGWAFRLTCALLLTFGSALFAGFAWAVDRVGLGRGFALAILVSLLLGLPGGAVVTYRYALDGIASPAMIALLAAMAVGLLLGLGWLWRRSQAWLGPLPARLPTSGLLPLDLALLVASLPSLLATIFWFDGLEALNEALVPGSTAFLLLVLALTALLVAPASALFYFRRRRDFRSQATRRTWITAQALSAAFLVGLVCVDHLIGRIDPAAFNLWPGALTLVALWALGGDWLAELRARWQAAGGAELQVLETHQDLSDALASLAVYRQLQPGLAFVLTGARYRALTYFFGPFAPLTILGPPAAKPRSMFPGGQSVEEVTLAERFE